MRSESSLAELNKNNNEDMEIFTKMGNNADISAPQLESDSHVEKHYYQNRDEQPGMVGNTVLIHSGVWDPTDPVGITYGTGDIWNAMLTQQNFATRAKSFTYATGSIKVIINTQGFAPAYGRMVVMAVPSAASFTYGIEPNCRILPHVIIDPSQSATYELILPLYSNTGAFAVKGGPTWSLRYYVYNTLKSGTDVSNSIRFVTRAAVDDVHFVGKSVPLGDFQELTEPVKVAMSTAAAVVKTSIKATIPHLATMSQVLANSSTALRELGFSKPQTVGLENPRLNNTADNYTQVDGISTAVVLGRSQIMESTVDPGIMLGKAEDMELSYLLSKLVRLKQVPISPVDSTKHLFTLPVIPHDSSFTSLKVTERSVAQDMSEIHNWWSGTMKFIFEVPASVFQRCVLFVAYDPSPNSGVPPTINDAMQYLDNHTIVVSGNTSVTFSVPWRSPSVALPTNTGYNGVLYIYLLEPLISNGSESPIEIDIIGDWSEINFHYPENRLSYVPLADWIETSHVSFGTQSINHTVMVGGDTTRSVKDLACRMSTTEGIAEVEEEELQVSVPNSFTNSNPLRPDWGKYISRYYLGVRGSRRLSVIVPNSRNTDVGLSLRHGNLPGVVWQPLATYNELIIHDQLGATIVNVDVASTCDVILPYVSNHMYEYGCRRDGGMTYAVVRMHSDTCTLLQGAGDDTIYGFFLGVPTILTPT